jgi:prepilin-type processing-associated H-X9-DG protein
MLLPSRSSVRSRAFSLVEILVIIGILSILVGLLLPTLASAREAANRTKCMSNLRQIALAFTMYLNDNNGRFPRPAQRGDASVQKPEDWVHFQRWRDPQQSPIAKYLGKPFNQDVLRCPSDDVSTHRTETFGGQPVQYPYSYTVNELICRLPSLGPTLRIGQIRKPEEKILLVDESSNTIDDGCWAWQASMGSSANVLSNRHDRKTERPNDPKFGRGNAAFVDGHVAYITRADSFDPRFYDPLRR